MNPPLPACPAPCHVHVFMVFGQSGLIGYLLLTLSLHVEVELSAVTCFLEVEGYEAVTFVNLGSNSSPKAMQRTADIARKGEWLIETIWGMQYWTRGDGFWATHTSTRLAKDPHTFNLLYKFSLQ